MRPLLIDDLLKEDNFTQSEFIINLHGTTVKGYQIAKPLNYDKEYVSFFRRLKCAILVLRGKGITVQFFEDLTSKEQYNYVKKYLEKRDH